MTKDDAIETGARALFGEKYGETVRVVIMDFDFSVELCGGTHVVNTGELGYFKIKSESAIGAGVRRIEAVSGKVAEDFINQQFEVIHKIRETLKNPKDITKTVDNIIAEKNTLSNTIEKLEARILFSVKNELIQKIQTINNIKFIGEIVNIPNADSLKKLCFSLKNELKNYVFALAADIEGKPYIAIMIDDDIVASQKFDASKIIKEMVAPLLKGGGGGQKTFATAGGLDSGRLAEVIEKVRSLL